MSPATKEATEKTWTLREVEKQTATLEELRTKLVELREREETLRDEIAEAIAAGEDPEDLQTERREATELRKDLEAAEPILEERIRERRFLALQERARQELQSIRKSAGGIVGEFGRQIERAEEYREKYLAAATYLEGAPLRLRFLGIQAGILARTFDLEEPDLKRPDQEVAKRAKKAAEPIRRPTVGRDTIADGVNRALREGRTLDAARVTARFLRELFEEDQGGVVELLELMEETDGEA